MARVQTSDHEQVLQPLADDEQPRPVSQAGVVHAAPAAHVLLPHVTSQLHAEPQVTAASHAPWPVHETRHGPAPHVTPSSHELLPLHVTLHDAASVQSTRSHASPLLQPIVQL